MTVSDPTDTEAVTDHSGLSWPEREGAVHQPRRALVAVGELAVAGLLAWLAVWLWGQGIDVIGRVRARPELVVERFRGEWIAGSIAVATLGAIVALDAVRQIILAVRSRAK